MKKIKNIATLLFSSLMFYGTTQAMELSSELYDEKGDISFLMQAIEKVKRDQSEESEEELKIVEQNNVKFKAVKNYACLRENCIFVASHQKRIDKHREMHRRQDAFLSVAIYRCETCHYLTNTKRNIKEHKQSHDDTKQYYCELCNAWFKSVRSRNRHEKKSVMHKQNSIKDRPLLVLTNG